MKEVVDVGRKNPDPGVQTKWAGFEYSGGKSTLEGVCTEDGVTALSVVISCPFA